MASPFPKPESQKVGRTKPTHDWVNLPKSGNPHPAPALPARADDGVWSAKCATKWQELWATPESLMWNDAGSYDMAHLYLRLMEQLDEGKVTAALLTGMKDCQRQLGLTQKDKLSLRWRVVADEFANPEILGEPDARPLAVVETIGRAQPGDARIVKRNPPKDTSRARAISYDA